MSLMGLSQLLIVLYCENNSETRFSRTKFVVTFYNVYFCHVYIVYMTNLSVLQYPYFFGIPNTTDAIYFFF